MDKTTEPQVEYALTKVSVHDRLNVSIKDRHFWMLYKNILFMFNATTNREWKGVL